MTEMQISPDDYTISYRLLLSANLPLILFTKQTTAYTVILAVYKIISTKLTHNLQPKVPASILSSFP